jgi:hypothetical protein
MSWVRFPALSVFLRCSRSGTGPFSLVSTTEELLGRKSSGSGLESREYGRRDPSRRPRGTLYPQTLALTPPASGFRSDCIFRSRTHATKLSLFFIRLGPCGLRHELSSPARILGSWV